MWPPGHDERDEREDRIGSVRLAGIAQPRGVDVALEVVDPDERHVVDPGERLGEVDADQQRAGQARSVGDRDRVDVVPGRAGVGPRLVEDRHDPAQVGAGGDLGHDPAGRGVERDLRGDDVGVDPPAVLDQRDARLVARRFDGEDQPAAHPTGLIAADPREGRFRRGRRASGRAGAGAASMAARSRAIRSRIAGSASGSVVMIRASSPLSL